MKTRKYIDVPLLWFDVPTLFTANVTSLSNKVYELVLTVGSIGADIV